MTETLEFRASPIKRWSAYAINALMLSLFLVWAHRRSSGTVVSFIEEVADISTSFEFLVLSVTGIILILNSHLSSLIIEKDHIRIKKWYWYDKMVEFKDIQDVYLDTSDGWIVVKMMSGRQIDLPGVLEGATLESGLLNKNILQSIEERREAATKEAG